MESQESSPSAGISYGRRAGFSISNFVSNSFRRLKLIVENIAEYHAVILRRYSTTSNRTDEYPTRTRPDPTSPEQTKWCNASQFLAIQYCSSPWKTIIWIERYIHTQRTSCWLCASFYSCKWLAGFRAVTIVTCTNPWGSDLGLLARSRSGSLAGSGYI